VQEEVVPRLVLVPQLDDLGIVIENNLDVIQVVAMVSKLPKHTILDKVIVLLVSVGVSVFTVGIVLSHEQFVIRNVILLEHLESNRFVGVTTSREQDNGEALDFFEMLDGTEHPSGCVCPHLVSILPDLPVEESVLGCCNEALCRVEKSAINVDDGESLTLGEVDAHGVLCVGGKRKALCYILLYNQNC